MAERDSRRYGNSHAAVEVHAIDSDRRVVFDTQVDVFADAESKVARLREVLLPELVFLDFQSPLEDFLGLGAADGDVDGDFFVTADTECADCVAGFACWGERMFSGFLCGNGGIDRGWRSRGVVSGTNVL